MSQLRSLVRALGTTSRATILAGVAAFALAAPRTAAAQEIEPAAATSVGRVLSAEGPWAEELAALRPAPVRAMVRVVADGVVPGPWWGSERDLPLDAARKEAILEALRSTSFRSLQVPLLQLAESDAPWDERRVGMLALKRAVQPEAVHVLVALTRAHDDAPPPSEVRTTFEVTLRQLLANDVRNVTALAPIFTTIPANLYFGIFEILEPFPTPIVLDILAASLGRSSELDPLFLTLVSRLAQQAAPPFPVHVRQAVRPLLQRVDTTVVVVAIRATGHLGDVEAVPALVELLGSPHQSVHEAAHEALREITELGFPGEPERWERWLREEEQWWASEARGAGGDLERVLSREPGVAMRALRTIATKRLHRDEIARSLVKSLERVDADVGGTICGVLAGWRSVAELPALARLEETTRDPALRKALADLRASLLAPHPPR